MNLLLIKLLVIDGLAIVGIGLVSFVIWDVLFGNRGVGGKTPK